MSVEGLFEEVSALLGVRLTIKAADQAFFGDKQVFSNISNSAVSTNSGSAKGCPVQSAISNAKQIVDNALSEKSVSGNIADSGKILAEINSLRKENADIRNEIAQLKDIINKIQGLSVKTAPASASAPAMEDKEEKEDEDFDLFGSEDEEEDAEKKRITEERLKAYAEKKSKKAGPIAKSSVILDVKPWDDETDLKEMENQVRGIEMDGLVWGGAKLIPIGYGIQKLQIISVVEDLKVSVDDLIEKIQEFEDFVQSVDIVAFNKI